MTTLCQNTYTHTLSLSFFFPFFHSLFSLFLSLIAFIPSSSIKYYSYCVACGKKSVYCVRLFCSQTLVKYIATSTHTVLTAQLTLTLRLTLTLKLTYVYVCVSLSVSLSTLITIHTFTFIFLKLSTHIKGPLLFFTTIHIIFWMYVRGPYRRCNCSGER